MDTLESELTSEEISKVKEFYRRLKEPDLNHVKRVINSVDSVAGDYFSSGEQKSNYLVFCEGVHFSENSVFFKRSGIPFFAAYLVGGYLNKKGERPDIDLLVATNMRFTSGFLNPDQDPMWVALIKEFGEGYTIQRDGELPNDYNLGATKGKVLITINSAEGKKLDVSYVRSWLEEGFKFIDEKRFSQLDVGKNGKPLSRLPLYRSMYGGEF